jgi:hypothetical protein
MGIELELHARRPARRGRASRATLLRGSYDHGEGLAAALAGPGAAGLHRLAGVDPYGDTLFDEHQAAAALAEARTLLARCATPAQTAAVRDLLTMLEACARVPGGHLWFMGD